SDLSSVGKLDARHYHRHVAHIGQQVAESLDYAHSQGVLHRDIKPSNLILDRNGDVWVADFGLAKAFDSSEPTAKGLTATGDIVGTMRYMPPERFRGWSDPRSDIYGLGITLYELLTLQPAFDSEDRVVLMEQVQHQAPRAPRLVDRRIPKDLETIVLKAIDKDAIQRYATASEFAADLRNFLDYRPIQARRASPIEVARQWCRRNPLAAGIATVLMLAIAVGLASTTIFWRHAVRERDKALAEKRRADDEAAVAQAVNAFLQSDLLGQSDIANQPTGTERNRNITVRELLDRAAQGVEERFKGQERTEAAIQLTLGNSYDAAGEYSESQKHFQRALDLRQRLLGADHPDTLDAARSLGASFFRQEDYARAEQLFQVALRGFEARLGPTDLDVLLTRQYLASVYRRRGEFDKAEQMVRGCLDKLRVMPKSHDELRLSTMNTLALILSERRQDAAAESLQKEVLQGRRSRLGIDHPNTLESMLNLGLIYRDQGRYDEAQALFEQVVDIRQNKLGADHPETHAAMNSLAVIYVETAQFDKAEPLLKQLFEKLHATLGPEHGETLSVANNLATVHMYMGQFAKAEPLLKQVVTETLKTRGPDHPMTMALQGNLASCYMELGRLDEAEPIYRRLVSAKGSQFGKDHVETLRSLNDVANVLNARHKYEEAAPLFQEVYDGRLAKLGANHLETLISLNNLGLIMKSLGKLDDAERYLRQALDGRRANLGPDHPDTLRSLHQLGELLAERKRYDEAEPLLLQAHAGMLQRAAKVPGESKDRLTTVRQLLVQLYEAWDKPDEAAKWRDESDGASEG
ncbi:MAG TPA: tetratricopeptide repeat protein, partial [Pirellulaceae bacterium]